MSLPEYGVTDFQKASSHLIVAGLVIGTLLYFYAFARRTMYGFVPSFIKNISFIKNMNFFATKNFITFVVFLLILVGFMGLLDLVGQVQQVMSAPIPQAPQGPQVVAMFRQV